MPAPRLIARQTTPRPEARPVVPAQPEIAVARTPMAKVGPAGAVLRGAAGAGALSVWQLRPGSTVVVLASRGGWSEIDQQGLVGWIPTSALSD
jgi:SH3 domain-containing protein